MWIKKWIFPAFYIYAARGNFTAKTQVTENCVKKLLFSLKLGAFSFDSLIIYSCRMLYTTMGVCIVLLIYFHLRFVAFSVENVIAIVFCVVLIT